MGSWCMATGTTTRPGLATSGMVGPALGGSDGARVGPRGTIGALILVSAGVAALAGSVGGDVILPDHGGDLAGLGIVKVVRLPGDVEIAPARPATFTLDKVRLPGLLRRQVLATRDWRIVMRGPTTHVRAPWPPASAQASKTCILASLEAFMDLAPSLHEMRRALGPQNSCTAMRCRDTVEGAFMAAVLAGGFLAITMVAAIRAVTATVAVTRTVAGEAEAMEAVVATAEAEVAGGTAEVDVANSR